MCGICGVAAADPRDLPLEAPALAAMTHAIEHRGPDEDGHLLDPGVALGMRRLSIIDLAGSSQPVSNEDGSVQAVFNGEIYNFQELRGELRSRGHQLATGGDSETIVHLYEDHGTAFPERLRGMFAVALWDRRRRRLVLSRDRMGVKPLYVTQGSFGLAFASEVKSLIAGGLVQPALDPLAAELFMAFGYVPGPRTLFAGVRKLMPASTLVFEDGRLASEQPYWTPFDNPPDGVGRDAREDQERLLELLRASVHARMISDVPLGVMLSGGLDSSLITALMAEASPRPVKTFSVGFAEDAAANELGDAARVAGRLATDHYELETSALDHPELLDEALWHLEEPIADLSCLGFLLLSRLARETVTVALSGQGADELLGGYRKHQVAAMATHVGRAPRLLRGGLARAGAALSPESTGARGLAALTADDPAARMLAMSRVVQARERLETFAEGFLQEGAEAAIADSVDSQAPPVRLSPLGETLHLDTRMALVDNMLLYFDKMSMAASLEVRVPFMDHELVEFCAALPDTARVRGLRRKDLLKRASQGLVEPAIIDKKKRGFFHSALGTWLRMQRESILSEVLLDERTLSRGLYRPDVVRALVGASGDEGKKHSQRVFSMFLLEKWLRRFVDGSGRDAGQLVDQREVSVALAGPAELGQP
jgi:asparagine synthase (glutamine-hydrolysing)